MKKKLIASLAAAMVLGIAGTSFAATVNPFSDVPAKHWSYGAVTKLANDGILEGYGDGTFRGDKAISRYEMAIIVAKAMSKMDKANASDKALIEKLSTEYASELDKLGARMTTVENKVDNDMKFDGFIRGRYDSDSTDKAGNQNGGNKHYLFVLNGTIKVSDDWVVKLGNELRYGYTENDTSWGYGGDGGQLFRGWAEGKVGDVSVAAGRKWFGYGDNMAIGQESTGIWLDYGTKLKTSLFIAKPKSGVGMGSFDKDGKLIDGSNDVARKTSLYGVNFNTDISKNINVNLLIGGNKKSYNEKTAGVAGHYDYDKHGVGTWKNATNDKTESKDLPMSQWTQLTVGAKLSPELKLTASYLKTNADNLNKKIHVRLDYKGADNNVPGSYGIYARYFKFDAHGAPAADDEWGSLPANAKGWIIGYNRVLAKNLNWETLYSQQKTGIANGATETTRKLIRTQFQFNF